MIRSTVFPIVLALALAGGAAASAPPETPKGCVECAHIAALTDTLPGTFSDMVHGTFHEDITGQDRAGCMLVISGSWNELGKHLDPAGLIFNTLIAEGWHEGIAGGDGPDGTFFILVKGDVICLVRGRWDGGDDSDSTYVPSDVYQVVVICAPLLGDDRRRLEEDERR